MKRGQDASDAEEFARAMEGVKPLAPDRRGRKHATRSTPPPRRAARPVTEDDPGEEDEGFAACGVHRREIGRLTRGAYAPGDRLDLHGKARAQACESVERFLQRSHHQGVRCVSIVHGRGLHSESRVSVLKRAVRSGLRAHRLVLAYADAPRSDGGKGATYVLLRR